MAAKKKTWNKVNLITEIGKCRYCNLSMVNTDSFVVFLSTDKNGDKEKAHYKCMVKDDYAQLLKKQKEDNDKKRLSQNEIR
tara:strand:+ start:27 stop:269 length:243 start_codon:yes stop_codon:yes gene_type:complete